MTWQQQAACRGQDTDLFVGDSNAGARYYDVARRVCAVCPVVDECLQYALDNGISMGLWGGMSPDQRAKFARNRRASA